MINYIRRHTVTITIAVSFFVFGFFVAANILRLSDREILIGLISGAAGGITVMMASMIQERRSIVVSTGAA